jgi:hypothetical protein
MTVVLLFHALFMIMRREHHHILIDKEVTTQERWTKNGFLHFFLLLNLHVDNLSSYAGMHMLMTMRGGDAPLALS